MIHRMIRFSEKKKTFGSLPVFFNRCELYVFAIIRVVFQHQFSF